ncbi:hypothetical protein HHK36_004759 [Tetracentron sinense]|uniref:Uncharacterized protein n=1 Tax=Tetracentron sinense TaxID=13715 RepID=A0A834ZJP5_TETSI|nr:hypothetical protein HHK36_004759 [Tetracentron sinense]
MCVFAPATARPAAPALCLPHSSLPLLRLLLMTLPSTFAPVAARVFFSFFVHAT